MGVNQELPTAAAQQFLGSRHTFDSAVKARSQAGIQQQFVACILSPTRGSGHKDCDALLAKWQFNRSLRHFQ